MGMTLWPSLSLLNKLTINHAPIEATKHFNYLGMRFSENLSWHHQVRKAAIALKEAAGAILKFKHKAGGQSISIIMEIYVRKAVAAALYGAELWGYMNTRVMQVAENNFQQPYWGWGRETPRKALFEELNLMLISDLAALRPILYWVRLVRNPRVAIYLETSKEVIVYDGCGGAPGELTSKRLWETSGWRTYGRTRVESARIRWAW
ncbi:hypothetical protein NDU88_006212 [Pleurodeles waltl]|uniref:Uncharacterized protein n=1 Tax=Pleurodeles waltl TaxID=8319 RepID=A0AAV7QLA4_PLEWA|nr:hypothetical protein NDU88_006212 [Pleurodeles waltl]